MASSEVGFVAADKEEVAIRIVTAGAVQRREQTAPRRCAGALSLHRRGLSILKYDPVLSVCFAMTNLWRVVSGDRRLLPVNSPAVIMAST